MLRSEDGSIRGTLKVVESMKRKGRKHKDDWTWKEQVGTVYSLLFISRVRRPEVRRCASNLTVIFPSRWTWSSSRNPPFKIPCSNSRPPNSTKWRWSPSLRWCSIWGTSPFIRDNLRSTVSTFYCWYVPLYYFWNRHHGTFSNVTMVHFRTFYHNNRTEIATIEFAERKIWLV